MTRGYCEYWEHWWMRRAPPHALALLRIAFGSFLFLYWTLKVPQVSMLFSDRGLILPLSPSFSTGPFAVLFPPSPAVAFTMFGVFLACILLFTFGIAMRGAGCLAVLFSAYYWALSLHLFGTSFDRLFMLLLLILACSGADRTLSLRAWRRHGSILAWDPASILPQRLIALEIAAVYLGVGLQKSWLPDWQGGEALSWSLVSAWGTGAGFALIRANLPMAVYDVLVFVTKFVECVLPFGLWIPLVRRWCMLAGAAFHLLIALFLGIWWFLILIPAYVVFFEPEEVFAWWQTSIRPYVRTSKNN